MSYLEDAVDNALFAEHLVPADEKDANTMGMMKSALAVAAGKGPWGVLLGLGRVSGWLGLVSGRCVGRLGRAMCWADGAGVRAMC